MTKRDQNGREMLLTARGLTLGMLFGVLIDSILECASCVGHSVAGALKWLHGSGPEVGGCGRQEGERL